MFKDVINLRYEGKVYRPPSEARSVIIQATIGCSHNKCTFCSMYKEAQFRIKKTDEILEDINKGARSEEIIHEANKLKKANILLSVTLITGLGGKEKWKQHALQSAKVINKIKPDYLGLLTLMIEPGTEMYDHVNSGEFQLLSPEGVALETLVLLENLDVEGCIFRSNHASNYISLKGTLNKDKDIMIKQLKQAMDGEVGFKDEVLRGL